MNYKLEKTILFEKNFKKLIPKELQKDVKNQVNKLRHNPYNSKPLGYKFFREKKIKKWRMYFLIYEETLVIYFISISDKKLQQKTINKIKSQFGILKKEIDNKYKL